MIDNVVFYKTAVIGIHHDEDGTELNFIMDDGEWSPIDSFCYISDEHLSKNKVIDYLLKNIDTLEREYIFYKTVDKR